MPGQRHHSPARPPSAAPRLVRNKAVTPKRQTGQFSFCSLEESAKCSFQPCSKVGMGFLTLSITSFEQLTATAFVGKLLCGKRLLLCPSAPSPLAIPFLHPNYAPSRAQSQQPEEERMLMSASPRGAPTTPFPCPSHTTQHPCSQ